MADTTELEESILRTLQSAFDADPSAMRSLVVNRVPCNQELADHPSIVVSDVPIPGPPRFEVGLIGVIVGLMCDAGCRRVVGWKFDKPAEDSPDLAKFLGFALVERNPCASA